MESLLDRYILQIAFDQSFFEDAEDISGNPSLKEKPPSFLQYKNPDETISSGL